jgi:hypothetical protein
VSPTGDLTFEVLTLTGGLDGSGVLNLGARVLEGGDDPPIEQPEALLRALRTALALTVVQRRRPYEGTTASACRTAGDGTRKSL